MNAFSCSPNLLGIYFPSLFLLHSYKEEIA
jgi:hypothetical protein